MIRAGAVLSLGAVLAQTPEFASRVELVTIDAVVLDASGRPAAPTADVLRLTTPVLTDRVERGKSGNAHPRAAILLGRVFRPRGPLYCEFEVLGAVADKARRAPRVTAGVEVCTSEGKVVRSAEPTAIAPDPRGRLLRLVGIGMDGLPEGDYRLVLDVRDEVAGKRIERQEPFTLRSRPD